MRYARVAAFLLLAAPALASMRTAAALCALAPSAAAFRPAALGARRAPARIRTVVGEGFGLPGAEDPNENTPRAILGEKRLKTEFIRSYAPDATLLKGGVDGIFAAASGPPVAGKNAARMAAPPPARAPSAARAAASARSTGAPYAEAAYDPGAAAAFYGARRLRTWARLFQLARLSGGFVASALLDRALGRDADEAVIAKRSRQLLDLVARLGPTFIKVRSHLSLSAVCEGGDKL